MTDHRVEINDAFAAGYELGLVHGSRRVETKPHHPGQRTAEAYRPDVRPHVPDVDPNADPRLHLIVDGVSACGLQSPHLGTHNPVETDCSGCTAALQREAAEAGLPEVAGYVAGLVERAGEYTQQAAQGPSASEGDDGAGFADRQAIQEAQPPITTGAGHASASAGNQSTDLRSELRAAPWVFGLTDDALRRAALTLNQQRVDVGRNEIDVHARGDTDETACGIHYADVALISAGTEGLTFALAVSRADVTCAPCLDALRTGEQENILTDERRAVVPGGWEKIAAGPERVEDDRPLTRTCRDTDLVDMTDAVVKAAQADGQRWWQCRHCGRGRVMGPVRFTSVRAVVAECLDHEAHCEYANG